MRSLTNVLESDQPTALHRTEDALVAEAELPAPAEVTLTALIWRRRIRGNYGVLGTFVYPDCTKRVGCIADHLDRVGAHRAAEAVRCLRRGVPYSDDQIANGIVDWIDMDKTLEGPAREYDRELEDITPQIWSFMKANVETFPEIEIPARRRGLFARLIRRSSR